MRLRCLSVGLIALASCGSEITNKDDAATKDVEVIDTGVIDEAGHRILCGDDAGNFTGAAGTCQYGNGPVYTCNAGCDCDVGECKCTGGGAWPGCMCSGGARCTWANCGNVNCYGSCACLDPARGTCFCPL